MNSLLYILSLLLMLFMQLAIFPSSAKAADNASLARQIIREELIYPKEARYFLPATLPDRKSSDIKNTEYFTVARVLAQQGVLTISTYRGISRLAPADDSIDVAQQNINTRYELQSLNLILGVWDVTITGVKRLDNKIYAKGDRNLKEKTRIHDIVLNALAKQEQKKYSSIPMQWEISINGNIKDVIERGLE